jgi:transcriptional regulator with XRE-family HTH domain
MVRRSFMDTESTNKQMDTSTKLQRLLIQRGLSQSDLQKKVHAKTGIKIEPYRVSKIVNGSITNYFTETARAIATTLEVPIEAILEDK